MTMGHPSPASEHDTLDSKLNFLVSAKILVLKNAVPPSEQLAAAVRNCLITMIDTHSLIPVILKGLTLYKMCFRRLCGNLSWFL